MSKKRKINRLLYSSNSSFSLCFHQGYPDQIIPATTTAASFFALPPLSPPLPPTFLVALVVAALLREVEALHERVGSGGGGRSGDSARDEKDHPSSVAAVVCIHCPKSHLAR